MDNVDLSSQIFTCPDFKFRGELLILREKLKIVHILVLSHRTCKICFPCPDINLLVWPWSYNIDILSFVCALNFRQLDCLTPIIHLLPTYIDLYNYIIQRVNNRSNILVL